MDSRRRDALAYEAVQKTKLELLRAFEDVRSKMSPHQFGLLCSRSKQKLLAFIELSRVQQEAANSRSSDILSVAGSVRNPFQELYFDGNRLNSSINTASHMSMIYNRKTHMPLQNPRYHPYVRMERLRTPIPSQAYESTLLEALECSVASYSEEHENPRRRGKRPMAPPLVRGRQNLQQHYSNQPAYFSTIQEEPAKREYKKKNTGAEARGDPKKKRISNSKRREAPTKKLAGGRKELVEPSDQEISSDEASIIPDDTISPDLRPKKANNQAKTKRKNTKDDTAETSVIAPRKKRNASPDESDLSSEENSMTQNNVSTLVLRRKKNDSAKGKIDENVPSKKQLAKSSCKQAVKSSTKASAKTTAKPAAKSSQLPSQEKPKKRNVGALKKHGKDNEENGENVLPNKPTSKNTAKSSTKATAKPSTKVEAKSQESQEPVAGPSGKQKAPTKTAKKANIEAEGKNATKRESNTPLAIVRNNLADSSVASSSHSSSDESNSMFGLRRENPVTTRMAMGFENVKLIPPKKKPSKRPPDDGKIATKLQPVMSALLSKNKPVHTPKLVKKMFRREDVDSDEQSCSESESDDTSLKF